MIDPEALLSRSVAPSKLTPPKGSGVYAYYTRHADCLPQLASGPNGIIYVGMTEQGLDARNHVTHSHSGFSTFRRSLGALLKDDLDLCARPRSSGASISNTRCYRFDEAGEKPLSEWMEANLLCAQIEAETEVASIEGYLIQTLEPPLNLQGWRNPQAAAVKVLRAVCVAEAEPER
jgi:hypothetical protein